MGRFVAAFDFDYTIVEENSDIVARDLLPPEALTAGLESLHRSDGWTSYMQEIFRLHTEHAVPREDLRRAVVDIQPVPRMDDFLRYLDETGLCDTIIISDSNSYFIEEWLRARKLKVLKV
jgi:pyridoxal phosphate phosphatase PHOSPHO2